MFELGFFGEASCGVGNVCVRGGRPGQEGMVSKSSLDRQERASILLADLGLVLRPWLKMFVDVYMMCSTL